mgnify:CR=1 FL=1
MTGEIALILSIDGLATGTIYVLVGLGLVLVFSVTRVVFVPFGDVVSFTALTLAALQLGRLPGTVILIPVLAAVAFAMEAVELMRRGEFARLPRALVCYGIIPVLPAAVGWLMAGREWPDGVQIVLAIALVAPMAPLLDRIAFRPLADASVLLLLIVAVAVHFALAGTGLLIFGAEGFRTHPLATEVFNIGGVIVSAQVMLMIVAALLFSLLLYLFFERTITGKALRATAVNRVGARLVGIRPGYTGTLAFLIASLLPGDLAYVILGDQATPDMVAALRHDMGLDQPLWWRYLSWLGHILQGDLGRSFITSRPVARDVAERFPQHQLWPADQKQRARARSLCAELPSVSLHIHDRATGDDLTPEHLAATATDGTARAAA